MIAELIAAESSEDWARIAALFELYAYDWSEMVGIDVGDDGRFAIPALRRDDPPRHGFVVRCEGKLAGFALVDEVSRLSGDRSVRDLAELFVMRKYRRQRVGEQVALALFQRFPGRWEVRQRRENVAATAFWRRVIARHAPDYEEVVLDDARWRGPVQSFDNGARR